ncbi:MAG: caspase family protein, partial [Chloroflexi bacterium]|nr:caspase family protein [Chloroflexota bacterium]
MYAPLYKASYALVIGVDQYTDLPPLQTAVHDAEAVADQLGGMGFDVQMLLNDEASRDAILENVDRLTNTEPDDRVIIYFAGHGITRSTTTGHSVGMLAPYGQRRSAYHQAIQMKTLIEHSQFIPAKHILFLLDACFSGLALTRGGGAPNRVIADLLTRRAVQVIAAGQAEQEVSDLWGPGSHSIFTGLML